MLCVSVQSTVAPAVRVTVADDTAVVTPNLPSTDTNYPCLCDAIIQSGATAGIWQLRLASENTNAVTVKAKSYLRLTRLM
jgi:hypothetical protein